MKKLFALLILFNINIYCMAQNILDEGTFVPSYCINQDTYCIENDGLYKCFLGNTLSILYNIKKYSFGSFSLSGIAPVLLLIKK